jgi:hypothetical protein
LATVKENEYLSKFPKPSRSWMLIAI